MTALATINPIGQFFGLDGSPLNGGRLYFGQVDQNPITAPVTVYWDADATQPAAQPIATLNGYPVRSGTPAIVYSSVDYSLLVQDSRGRQVLYAPDSASTSNDLALQTLITTSVANIRADLASKTDAAKNAGQIGFNPALNYAAGTVGAEFRLTVTPEMFGAVGDGQADGLTGTDDWQALQDCMDWLADNGGGVMLCRKPFYYTKFRLQPRTNVVIRGTGPRSSCIMAHPDSIDNIIGVGGVAYQAEGPRRAASYAPAVELTTKADFSGTMSRSVALFEGGYAGVAVYNFGVEDICIHGNKANRQLPTAWLVNGSGLFLNDETVTSSGGASGIVSQAAAYGGGGGANYLFHCDPPTETGTFAIGQVVTGAESGVTATIVGTTPDDSLGMNINLEICLNSWVRRCTIRDSIYEALLLYNESNFTVIEDNDFYNNNRADAEAFTKNLIICDFNLQGVAIRRNSFFGGLGYGVVLHDPGGTSRDITVIDNDFVDTTNTAINLDKAGNVYDNVKILNNRIHGTSAGASSAGVACVNLAAGSYTGLEIASNHVDGMDFGIIVGPSVGTVDGVTIHHNQCKSNNTGLVSSATNARIHDNDCRGNVSTNYTLSGVGLYEHDNMGRGVNSFSTSVTVGPQLETPTTGISATTSPSPIYTLASSLAGLDLVVKGDSAGNQFRDAVSLTAGGNPITVTSTTLALAPATRTYSRSGDVIRVAMGAGTYTLKVDAKEIS